MHAPPPKKNAWFGEPPWQGCFWSRFLFFPCGHLDFQDLGSQKLDRSHVKLWSPDSWGDELLGKNAVRIAILRVRDLFFFGTVSELTRDPFNGDGKVASNIDKKTPRIEAPGWCSYLETIHWNSSFPIKPPVSKLAQIPSPSQIEINPPSERNYPDTSRYPF